MTLTNNRDALVLALTLAVTAPDDARDVECVRMADELAASMDAATVTECKRLAELAWTTLSRRSPSIRTIGQSEGGDRPTPGVN